LTACAVRPLSSREIQESTSLRHRETFQRNYLDQIINDGLVERTIPEKPTSRLQKYRITEKGRILLEQLDKKGRRS
jgi:predicted transcriptional regulator